MPHSAIPAGGRCANGELVRRPSRRRSKSSSARSPLTLQPRPAECAQQCAAAPHCCAMLRNAVLCCAALCRAALPRCAAPHCCAVPRRAVPRCALWTGHCYSLCTAAAAADALISATGPRRTASLQQPILNIRQRWPQGNTETNTHGRCWLGLHRTTTTCNR